MDKNFLPYEESLELKKLGLKLDYEECFQWWVHSTLLTNDNIFRQYSEEEDFCDAPLYQQAFKWFREEHNLFFTIEKIMNGFNWTIKGDKIYKSSFDYLYDNVQLLCIKSMIEIVKNKFVC